MTETRAFRKTRIGLFLTNNGLDAGNILLDRCNLHGVIQLIGCVLHPQHEQVLLQFLQLFLQFFNRQAANFLDFFCLHLIHHQSQSLLPER